MSAANYHIGTISPEQFIAEYTFMFIIKGMIHLYDGSKNYTLKSGECGLARKNRLARFMKEKENNELEKVFVFFDETFLRAFQEKHQEKVNEEIADVKHEELLIILLQEQPELAGLFFDYGIPKKINIEEFMNRNFKFNVTIERFAYLTGRSLSAFKRDFKAIFN